MSLDQRIAEVARLGMTYGKYMAWRREQGLPESHHRPKPILETGTVNVGVCVICGGNIMRHNRRGTPNTCSKECKDELNRRRARVRYHEKKTEHPQGVEHTTSGRCSAPRNAAHITAREVTDGETLGK